MKERLLAAIGPLVGLAVFVAAAVLLHRELSAVRLHALIAQVASIPGTHIALAGALTLLGYLSLTGYDALAFRWIRSTLDYPRIALASFVAYVFSHNLGFALFGGSAVRFRMYTTWGVRSLDLGRVISFNIITFWLGWLAMGGLALTFRPIPVPHSSLAWLATSRPLGIAMLAALALWTVVARPRGRVVRVRSVEVEMPGARMTAAQVGISSLDWLLAAGVFASVLPAAPGLGFPVVVGAFCFSQVLGLVSQVPGGIGVFETSMVLLLGPWLPADSVLGSAVAFRLVYYLCPMLAAGTLFAGFEVAQRRAAARRLRALAIQWVPELVPRLFAIAAMVAGAILLLSVSTPAAPGRIDTLTTVLVLPLVELFHLSAAVLGVALLLLARALQQRVDAAYYATLTALVAGSASALGKGLDWEEASVLLALAAALLPCHRYFYRRSSLLSQSFSPAWISGIASVLVASTAVLLLAYRHVSYAHDLWWRFEADANASRSLRGLAVAGATLLFFWVARVLRPAPPVAQLPGPVELARAGELAAGAPRASAHLALLGDKQLLFSEKGDGFLMYGVHGRGWVSMGDPVGPPAVRQELAWRFRELADLHGGIASFYEVGPQDLPLYLDLGLRLHKVGEEARVPLVGFTLEGSARARLRHAVNRMGREGGRFEMLPSGDVPPLLDELERVSDEWLAQKNTREKRFSLGRFDRDYLSRLPLAVVRREDRIIAFANVWATAGHEEISIDLMRHTKDAPGAVMEYLFAELMRWGSAQGFEWFSLGMAPLAGLEHHRLAPLWNRLGALLFRHGEHFYNFQGLRAFKEKFGPVWDPRYLATPGGLSTPLALGHVAALVNGGVAGAVAR